MPEAEAAAILYRDDSLMVRHFTGNGGPTCVVTFDSFTDISTLDRLAFGETLFLHEGIDAVHVLSSDNRWYQYAAMADAAAAIRAVTAGYDRVVTYGSSMGGYAALRLAGLVGATVALALSPQWSIDWRRAPWERRWAENSRSFEDVWERSIPPPALAQAWVVYDPLLKDRRHVRKLRREGYVFQPVEIPGGGHPVGSFLAEVGLLRPAVMDVIADRFDPGRLQREAARRRPDSAQALLAQSSRLPKARIQGRLELLRRAAQIAPDNPIVLSRLALELAWAGLSGEAIDLHERALSLQRDQPTLLMHLSCSLEIGGDLSAARRVMEQACAVPGGQLYLTRLAALANERQPLSLSESLWRRLSGRRPLALRNADV